LGFSPVTKDRPLSAWGSNRELKGRVKVVLLLIRAVDHLSGPNHEETRVSEVGCVQPVTLPVQNNNTGCAATCRNAQKGTKLHTDIFITVKVLSPIFEEKISGSIPD